MRKTAVIITNLGTPDSTKTSDVRKYLFQFLNDRRVIDIPLILQKILVNLIIVPFRAPKSAKIYRILWTDKGSPLLYYTENLVRKLNERSDGSRDYFLAMRYGNPGIPEVMEDLRAKGYDNFVVFPMYPQYASSTTGSTHQEFMDVVKKWEVIPDMTFIGQFYDDEDFIKLFANKIASYNPEEYDHVVFSYHGLPIRHVNKTHPGHKYPECRCDLKMPEFGKYCYSATCHETTRKLVKELGLSEDKYTVAFQSRLDNKWLKPFSDKVLDKLAKEGKKKVLITAPSFVADCLETNVELGVEYKEEFDEAGGEELVMVDSLNDSDEWVNVIENIIKKHYKD